MIWQNPWALAGLVALAIPVAIHLLSRRNARVERFPTLRFLPVSQSAPVRLTRITDALLLAVRVLIVAAAVAALAQPLWLTATRTAAAGRRVVRAIVVDTSESMQRGVVPGVAAADSARRVATALAGSASTSLVIETANPADVMRGASSWLSGQDGRRELIVVSDFQAGTLDSIDLREVQSDIAIHLERIAVAVPGAPAGTAIQGRGITLLTAPASRERADAAMFAASPLAFDTNAVAITIVYPDADERAGLIRDAKPVTDTNLADAIVRLRRDVLLDAAIAVNGDTATGGFGDTKFARVAHVDAGRAPVYAAQARVNARDALVLFPSFDPGSLASAALIAAAARAVSHVAAPGESNPDVIPDAVLSSWNRPGEPGRVAPGGSTGESDGRWLWLAAILLLLAETVMRRRPGDAAANEVANAAR